tara:strand:- start:4074 stop:4886 length:813 start_codon:yes stop_codon:yes gene_type:complete
MATGKIVPWNKNLEEVAKDIGESATAYKIMHISQSQNALATYTYLMLAGIVLGPLSGIVSAIGAALLISDLPLIVISEIVLGFLSGIVVAILKFGKYDEVSISNKTAAAKYASLESNIRRQLCLYRSERLESSSYLEIIESKYNALLDSAPVITHKTFDSYSVNAEKNGLKIPNKYEHNIFITEDYDETMANDIMNVKKISTIEENEEEIIESRKPEEIVVNLQNSNNENAKMKKLIKINRNNTMVKIPEINSCSDKMLEYEMKRMMGFR